MSETLTARQESELVRTASVRRQLDVPDLWAVTRLAVLVDARVPSVVEGLAKAQALALGEEMAGYLRCLPHCSTHGHERAAAVLQDIRVNLRPAVGSSWRVVLSGASDPDVAAETLASYPHGALVVAVAYCHGRALAARWS